MIDYRATPRTIGIVTPGPLGKNHFWSGPKNYGPITPPIPGYLGEGRWFDPDAGKKHYWHAYGCICDLCAADTQKIPKSRAAPPIYPYKEHVAIGTITMNRDTASGVVLDLVRYCGIQHGRRHVIGEFDVLGEGIYDFLLIAEADYCSEDMKLDDFVGYLFSGKCDPLVQKKIKEDKKNTHVANAFGVFNVFPRDGWLGWEAC